MSISYERTFHKRRLNLRTRLVTPLSRDVKLGDVARVPKRRIQNSCGTVPGSRLAGFTFPTLVIVVQPLTSVCDRAPILPTFSTNIIVPTFAYGDIVTLSFVAGEKNPIWTARWFPKYVECAFVQLEATNIMLPKEPMIEWTWRLTSTIDPRVDHADTLQ
ncbi:hypothetical protein BS47DRAFT_1340547 [Hydnum rufescens UP504]|uniref:Uncharacterized protein n=1 Tax=Hydnum rufescens UP504 TaxID=1448309 RepID=A0A9P6B3F0_9AGAM|nr:hypothetical protein BS47DRAFT_1340547 [Hydnum rufescens UP504]